MKISLNVHNMTVARDGLKAFSVHEDLFVVKRPSSKQRVIRGVKSTHRTHGHIILHLKANCV